MVSVGKSVNGDATPRCNGINIVEPWKYSLLYPFPSSLALKVQTKILFLIFPAVLRVLFGQKVARAWR